MGKLKERLLEREKAVAEGRFPPLDLKEQDPVKWEILYTKIAGLVQSSRETAKLISASPVVREMGECLYTLHTPEGDAIFQSSGLLLHVASMGSFIKWMLKNDYEENEGIEEGDCFFNNNPYIGGAHSADMLIALPIFHEREIIGWAAGMTHTSESGAVEPGGPPASGQTVYEDGIIWPAIKYASKGRVNPDWERIIQIGCRAPHVWLLDNKAKMSGCRLIEEGLKRLVEQYGTDYYLKAAYEFIEDTRQAFHRKAATVFFPGRYQRVFFQDFPYADKFVRYRIDQEVRLPVEMTVTPDGVIYVDLDGTSPCGYFSNSPPTATRGNIICQMLQNLGYDIKVNHGIAQIAVEEPYLTMPAFGTVLNPRHDTCTAVWVAAGVMGNALIQCMAHAYYARGFREEVAAGNNLVQGVRTAGTDQHGRPFAMTIFEHSCAGMGARYFADGLDCALAYFNPEGDMSDAEVWEMRLSQMYLGRHILPDGGGFGKYRGGSSLESLWLFEHQDVTEQSAIGWGTRLFVSPGIMGGYPGGAHYKHLVRNTNIKELLEKRLPIPWGEGLDPANPMWQQWPDFRGETTIVDSFCPTTTFKRHDLWQQMNGNAGGYGDPLERDPALVASDIREEVGTLHTAQKVYCVALDPKTLEVDREETARLRQRRREERKAGGIPGREYWARERERVLKGDLPPVVKDCFNGTFKLSPKFLREFREFWQLPESLTQVK